VFGNSKSHLKLDAAQSQRRQAVKQRGFLRLCGTETRKAFVIRPPHFEMVRGRQSLVRQQPITVQKSVDSVIDFFRARYHAGSHHGSILSGGKAGLMRCMQVMSPEWKIFGTQRACFPSAEGGRRMLLSPTIDMSCISKRLRSSYDSVRF